MNKNLIATILKYGAIALFCLSVIGGLVSAQKEEMVLKEAEYSFEEDEYIYEKVFDGGMFFLTLISSAISCSFIYGLGELIQIQYNNGLMLYSIVEKNKDDNTDK